MIRTDAAVVGGGPGGYVAAICLAQKGLKTVLVERESVGGTCLNWGCIPTKSLLQSAQAVALLSEGARYGFDVQVRHVDYAAAQRRSRESAAKLAGGVSMLLRKNGVEVIRDTARLETPGMLALASGERLAAGHIVLATGARSRVPDGWTADGQILYSRDMLALTELPSAMIVVGAGAIGVEFACILNAYGVEVTLLEAMDRVLPLEDEDVSAVLAKRLADMGIRVMTGVGIASVKGTSDGVSLTLGDGRTLCAPKMLASVGVVPNSGELGLEESGVVLDARGYITVNDRMETNVKGLYAIGDVTGQLLLAHAASAQAHVAADVIAAAGKTADAKAFQALSVRNMPRCVYAWPQTASVGLTEAQARATGRKLRISRCPLAANGMSVVLGETEGFAKLVCDDQTGELLGAHLVGSHVSEMIGGISALIGLEVTTDELAAAVFPHPSVSEAVSEAAMGILGHAVHF